jgi:hypothetical protein
VSTTEGLSVFSLSQRLLGLAQSTDGDTAALRDALRKLRAAALQIAQ